MKFFHAHVQSVRETIAGHAYDEGQGCAKWTPECVLGRPKTTIFIHFYSKNVKITFHFFRFFCKKCKYDSVYKQNGNPGTRHDRAEGAFVETCTRFLLLFTFAKVAITRTQNDQFPIGNIYISENL